MGDRGGEGDALVSLGHALQATGDNAQGVERWRAARAIFENLGAPGPQGSCGEPTAR